MLLVQHQLRVRPVCGWDYVEMANAKLLVPLLDGSMVPIKQPQMHAPMKMLGTQLCPLGDNPSHLSKEKILNRVANCVRNSHLPDRLAWLSYRL